MYNNIKIIMIICSLYFKRNFNILYSNNIIKYTAIPDYYMYNNLSYYLNDNTFII